MTIVESGFTFTCGEDILIALLSEPNRPKTRGVLIVVGGPQYRAGSHRQFTLLARHLAQTGTPVMRFDYRGMGDSEGELRTFEQVELDIRAAANAFFERVPYLREIVLWGLCDAASAILFYAHSDHRVRGIALANPWARTTEGLAKARIRHYYLGRFLDPSLWRKIGRGEFGFRASMNDLLRTLRHGVFPRSRAAERDVSARTESGHERPLPDRMRDGLENFRGDVLLILSGNDLTAREFEDTVKASRKWRTLLKKRKITYRRLSEADHTFSRRQWRDQVAKWTEQWIGSW